MKKIVYDKPLDLEAFKAENILKDMEQDKEKLVKNWGQAKYDERLELLKAYIRENK